MPIAAVLLDLGFPPATAKAVPLLARTAGLLAHLAEEQEQPGRLPDGGQGGGGDRLRAPAEGGPADARRPRSRRVRGASSSRSTTRATARSSPTSSSARPSTARSSRRPASPRPAAAGGLGDIARLPLTEKRELRATRTPDNPFGAHLCAAPRRDRPDLLDERHDRHAELHPADRGRPRQLGDRLGAELRGVRRRARASASSPPTTPGRSWRVRRSPPSTASGCATSRSAPGTPSG